MTALQALLQQARSTPRPLRAAVSLLLALVLVAGGTQFPARSVAAEVTGTAVVVEAVGRIPGVGAEQAVSCGGGAAAITGSRQVRLLPRWLDLRNGGLAAARAPDVGPALRSGC